MNDGEVHFVGFAIGECCFYRANKRNADFFVKVFCLDGEVIACIVRYRAHHT